VQKSTLVVSKMAFLKDSVCFGKEFYVYILQLLNTSFTPNKLIPGLTLGPFRYMYVLYASWKYREYPDRAKGV
jgi:hypothetical protein